MREYAKATAHRERKEQRSKQQRLITSRVEGGVDDHELRVGVGAELRRRVERERRVDVELHPHLDREQHLASRVEPDLEPSRSRARVLLHCRRRPGHEPPPCASRKTERQRRADKRKRREGPQAKEGPMREYAKATAHRERKEQRSKQQRLITSRVEGGVDDHELRVGVGAELRRRVERER